MDSSLVLFVDSDGCPYTGMTYDETDQDPQMDTTCAGMAADKASPMIARCLRQSGAP